MSRHSGESRNPEGQDSSRSSSPACAGMTKMGTTFSGGNLTPPVRLVSAYCRVADTSGVPV